MNHRGVAPCQWRWHLHRHLVLWCHGLRQVELRLQRFLLVDRVVLLATFLLLFLLENKNATLSRERILNRVWGDNLDVNDRIVDITISRLRSALGEASGQIRTVIGRGYKITEA